MGGKGKNFLKRGLKGGGNIIANMVAGELLEKGISSCENLALRRFAKHLGDDSDHRGTGLSTTEWLKRVKPSAYGLLARI